jgi:hypothetical protein
MLPIGCRCATASTHCTTISPSPLPRHSTENNRAIDAWLVSCFSYSREGLDYRCPGW